MESSMISDSSMVMDEDMGEDDMFIDQIECSNVYEILLPFPIDGDKKYKQNAKPKKPIEIPFTGKGSGCKPGMDPGPYNPYWKGAR